MEDIELGDYSLGHNQIKGLKVSFSPLDGSHDEFDYKLSLDQEKFLGIESDKLRLHGSGRIVHGTEEGEGEEFSIDGPVQNLRLSFNVRQDVKGSLTKKIDFKSIDLDLAEDSVAITSASSAFNEHGHSTEVKKWVTSRLNEELHKIKVEGFAGKDTIIAKLPVLSLAPVIGLYFAAYGADKLKFTEDYVEYEFSPVSLRLVKANALYDEFIREIETDFAP